MARPSLDSPSMVELVNQAKNRRKSTPPSTSGGSSLSLLGDDETAPKGISSVAPKLPPIHHSQPELSSSHSEMEHEQLKRKYSVQNQTLAKNNSIMLSKLSSMETRLSELISENVSIRRQKSLKEGAIKDTLHKKLLKIEDRLYEKFDDIFQMFQDIRSLEDLPTNPKLELFRQSSGKEAIALGSGESTVLSPLSDTLVMNKQRSIEPVLEEENESPAKRLLETGAVGQRRKTIHPEPSIAVHTGRNEMATVEPDTMLTTLKSKVAESNKLVTSEPKLNSISARRQSISREPSSDSNKRKSIVSEPTLVTDKKISISSQPNSASEKRKSMVAESNSASDQRKSTPEPSSKRKSMVAEPTLVTDKRKSILSSDSKRKKRRTSVVDHEPIATTTESIISPQEQLLNSEVRNEDKNLKEKAFQVFSDMPSRPRRARKEVDYKTPSLNKKMRRETEWLVTAVGNEPIIKKLHKESTPKQQQQQQQQQVLTKAKSKEVEVKSEIPSTNREPLQTIDINSRDTIQAKILNKQPEDLSIFDFDDEAENRAPPIKKTYKRRVQAADLRRHSML